ncbi:MAG: late competence development ComFB family protein, partial [Candidatus Omnitrophica bacterium]|nr:late competence development ComFB family protein [Candidatus Omnitrophota bacterium]
MQAHNIMEDIVKNYLDEILSMRFDVCTCDICRQNILAYTLSRVPAQYVTTEIGAMHTLIEQIKVEHSSKILRELIVAIQLVKDNPRHEKIEDDNQAYQLLLKQIKLDRGADFSHYREALLKRRMNLRMKMCKVR